MSELSLDDLCMFVNGGAWSESEYVPSGHPVLKVSNIKGSSVDVDNLSYISDEGLKKYERNVLQENDLVIATVGSHQGLIQSAAGRTIVIRKNVAGYLLNQNAVCLRTKRPDFLDQRYLGYMGESELFKNYIQVRGRGAANQMRIAVGEIKKFIPILPRLPIQKKIAGILSAYDDLIENNLKRIKLLEEMAQITYEEWFVRLRFPGHELTPINPETGLPEGWSKTNLGSCFSHEIGGGWGEDESNDEFSERAYVIRGTDMDGLTLGSFSSIPVRFHKKSNISSRKLQHGDIIFEVSGGSQNEGVAKTSLITDSLLTLFESDVICASFCKLARPNEGFFSVFLFHFLRYLRKTRATEVFEIRSASNIVNYNWTAFLKFQKVKIPPKELLELFDKKTSTVHSQIYNLASQNQRLREARDILLPRLMTGVIDVESYDPARLLQEAA